jgi:pyruvate dehydrogenase complex dehydrogenase (E1) component
VNFGVNPAEWRGLLNSANAGELTLHPEIGKGLDKVCDDYLDKLDGILESAAYVRRVSGFGTLPSGQALEEKFSLKATGTAQSLDAVLMQHIDAVKIAKEVVAKAIANFVELDQSRADQFTGLDATP